MDLTTEFNKLRTYMDKRNTDGFKTYLKKLYENNPDKKEVISLFVESELAESTNRIKNTVNDIQNRMQLENIINILPMSQRIGSATVHL